MTDETAPTAAAPKVHWATQRKLDIEKAISEGREPPKWPVQVPSAARRKQTRVAAKMESDVPKPPKIARLEFLDGLTTDSCCNGCNPDTGCVITGDICGHPYKSGLQSSHKMKPAVLGRFAQAKAHLQHLAVDKRAG